MSNNHGTYRRQSSKQEVKLRASAADDDDNVIEFDLPIAKTDSRSNTNSGDPDQPTHSRSLSRADEMEICTFLTQGRYDREIVHDDLGLYYVYSISILLRRSLR